MKVHNELFKSLCNLIVSGCGYVQNNMLNEWVLAILYMYVAK